MQVHIPPLTLTGSRANSGGFLAVYFKDGSSLFIERDEARRLRDDIDKFLSEADSPIDGAHAASALDEERDNSDDDTMLLTEAEARDVLGQHTAGVRS